jgi:hypothetical protein
MAAVKTQKIRWRWRKDLAEFLGIAVNTVRLSNNLEKSNHRLTGYTQMKEG